MVPGPEVEVMTEDDVVRGQEVAHHQDAVEVFPGTEVDRDLEVNDTLRTTTGVEINIGKLHADWDLRRVDLRSFLTLSSKQCLLLSSSLFVAE